MKVFKMKRLWSSGFGSFNGGKEKSQNEKNNSSLASKLSVNEEYKEAFRTKSYLETRTKLEGELGQTFCNRLCSSSSSLSALNFKNHLTDCLMEPQQETLNSQLEESRNFHRLIMKFLESISESFVICESLLKSVHKTRVCHQKIKSVIENCSIGVNDPEKLSRMVFHKLSEFTSLKNPLSIFSEERFCEHHDSNAILLEKLSSKHKRIRRKAKIYKFLKKIGASGLVISHTAITITLLVIGLHSIIGVLAAPVLISCCSFGFAKTKIRGKSNKNNMLEILEAEFDAAAKGTFILMNDFDTMSRLAGRLYDEIEHRKRVAAMCVKSGKIEVLKAVVKELCVNDERFYDQLQELEEHVYLCLHTINRSRRLVLEQINGSPESPNH